MSVSSSLGLSCPRGGDFYVCEGNRTEFLGCCASNPCADGSGKCPTKDLRISSFNPDRYASIPPQGCDDPRPASQLFYTCTNNIPFIGCCAKNPCQKPDGLCPTDHLIGTTLSSDAVNRTIFTTKSSSSPSPSSTPNASSSSGLGTGAIVGIAIGAAVLVGVIVTVVWRCGWHARKRNERREPAWEPAIQSAHPSHHPEMGFTPQSPALYDPARGKPHQHPSLRGQTQLTSAASHISYATTAAPNSYPSTSPPHSPYFPLKHPGTPSVDDRHLSTYTDSNVSSLSGHAPLHPSQYPSAGVELHSVSELDGMEHQGLRAELGDGTPANLYGKGGDR
ncbi:hypothetical protein CSUB01_06940 [Colletotrichum sublineola]|uniref:Uncharacterized protein n=1 Tax=Colletotrichum sublineola TaxID=1173701 RepID=A0A066X7B8_COLSU|nr:hypothetical protein CSUB01_06940 [Colletotrichum sublineola]